MDRTFYMGNRKSLYDTLAPGSMVVMYSGHAPRKTADEPYPFFADRSFVYMTGVTKENIIFTAVKTDSGVEETMFILPPDAHAERWNGARIKAHEAEEISGVTKYRYVKEFGAYLKGLATSGKIDTVCLDFDKYFENEEPREAFVLAEIIKKEYPYLNLKNIHKTIANIRTIKKPCEIEAMRVAESINKEGIINMMKASKPGMYEYQYKNNFCIHYYDYLGKAQDGDMILNDVGSVWDFCGTDVSRGWPCNGKFTDKQKALYECAYETSNYMFSILKPGFKMAEVDATAKEYNAKLLREVGVLGKDEDPGKLIWHGGAHHVGFDTHDVVDVAGKAIEPGMVFCVDVGIYCEEWGIGFRLEDNCLITENGCENLSKDVPRSIEEIESIMA